MCLVGADTSTSTISMIYNIAQAAYGIYQTSENIKIQKIQTEQAENEARQNAEILRQKAIAENQEALEAARAQRLKTIQSLSQERANAAAGNFDSASQTTLDKLEDISAEGELDALNILQKGKNNAQKYLLDAERYEKKANLIPIEGKYKTYQALAGGIGSSVQSYISIVNQYKDIKEKEGIFQ